MISLRLTCHCCAAFLFLGLLPPDAAFAATPGITNTFQFSSFLTAGTKAANGVFDLEFQLFDQAVGGTQIGETSTASGVRVTKGSYGVIVDFGPDTFNGESRWVQVRYKKTNTTTFLTSPNRVQVLSVPYAMVAAKADHASTADTVLGSVNSEHANTADFATNSGHATTADFSNTADYATSAGNATTANSANIASSANFATNAAVATAAGSASLATTATYAINSGHAAIADLATTALATISGGSLPTGAHVFVTTGTLPVGFEPTSEAIYSQGEWLPLTNPPSRANESAAWCAAKGRLYRIGGDWQGLPTGTVVCYNPVQQTWETTASMLSTRTSSIKTSTAVVDDKIYVFGGGSDKCECFDANVGSWSTKASVPGTFQPGQAFAVGSDIHLFIGGFGTHYIYHTLTNTYSSRTETWDTDTAVGAAYNGTIYMLLNGAMYTIEPDTGAVNYVINMPLYIPNGYLYQAAVAGNKLYVIYSGLSLFEYDFTRTKWIQRARPNYTSVGYLASANGVLYTQGSGTGSGPELEKFVPGTDLYAIRKQ